MSAADQFRLSLRHYRETLGMSQEVLAHSAGLDRSYISLLERGDKSPTLTTIEKLSACLGVEPPDLLRAPRELLGPRTPADYVVRPTGKLTITRPQGSATIRSDVVVAALNTAHEFIDELYEIELDIASILGLRNLSAFIGELVAAAIVRTCDGLFAPNPHQDGYPDLLLLDEAGSALYRELQHRMDEKAPFSPFAGGGIEVKATCGSVPSPKSCQQRRIKRPGPGSSRIACMTGYDWKSHHRDTNNLLGVLWDFIDSKPRVVGMFYSGSLTIDHWGAIVQPKQGGGRTTSVSIMNRAGVKVMYQGWLCVLREGGYVEFLNRHNRGELIADG